MPETSPAVVPHLHPSYIVEDFLVAFEEKDIPRAKKIIDALRATQEAMELSLSLDERSQSRSLLPHLRTIAHNCKGNTPAAKEAAEKVMNISDEIGRRLLAALGCPPLVQPDVDLRQAKVPKKAKKNPKVRGLALDGEQLQSISETDKPLAQLMQNCFRHHRLDPLVLRALVDIANQEENWYVHARRDTQVLKPTASLLGLIIALLENCRETGGKDMTYEQVKKYCSENEIYPYTTKQAMRGYFNKLTCLEYLRNTNVIVSDGNTMMLRYEWPTTEE